MNVGCIAEPSRNTVRRRGGFPGAHPCGAVRHSKRTYLFSFRPAHTMVIPRSFCVAFLVFVCTSWLYPHDNPSRLEPRAQIAAPTDPTTLIKAVFENQK